MALKPIKMDSVEKFSALIIGAAGIGKTSLLRTIPDGENVCVLSAEGGLLSVKDLVESGKVQGFEISSFEDLKEAYTYLNTEESRKKYKWIFLDSLSEISAKCLEMMQNKYPAKSDSFNLWGDFLKVMTNMIKSFRDIKHYNVIFTSLVVFSADESNRRFYQPEISGASLKNKLTSYFDLALFYEMVPFEGEPVPRRALITNAFNNFPAKDRSSKLDLFEKPDLGHIQRKIFGNPKPKPEPKK